MSSLTHKSRPVKIGQTLELRIQSLSFHGGRGVARHEGFVIFTPLTAPQDLALIKIKEVKKNYAIGQLVQLIEPSPERTKPLCEYFQNCGGCSLQHIQYRTQITEKQKILEKTFQPLCDNDPSLFLPLKASPKEYAYRNRVKLKIKNGSYGYFKKQTHQFLPIKNCLIAHENIQTKIQEGPLKEDLQNNSKTLKERELFKEQSQPFFSQVNEDQNKYLIQVVSQFVLEKKPSKIFDLYCGSGNFSFPLAKALSPFSSQVIGVESSKQAIQFASEKIKKEPPNNTKNLSFVAQEVQVFLKNQRKEKNTLFLFDPPRAGLNHKIIQKTLELAPQFIIYISCNPSTLVRDLKFWVAPSSSASTTSPAAPSYKIKSIQGVDMFPQTHHIECIVLLERHS